MNTGKTHFKKGHVPWSKGKKGFQAAESHPNWKGGKTKRKDGYIYLNLNNKKYLEHRIIMEKYLGRKLKRKEVVHHINHKPSDNNIENLMLFRSQSDHLRIERAII